MIHYMNLHPWPFHLIATGVKTIELRLYDEKRKSIRIGDTITFSNTKNTELQLNTIVKEIHVFPTFTELYNTLPLDKCGYLPEELSTAVPKDMEVYYSIEKQKEFSVVGIELELI